jgi:hypothetical protein
MKYKAFEKLYCPVRKDYIEKGQVFEVDESKANNYKKYSNVINEKKIDEETEIITKDESKVKLEKDMGTKKEVK